MIRPAHNRDADQLSEIYNHYINQTTATFEESPVTPQDMLERVSVILASDLPWLVAHDDKDKISGYAYADTWKARSAYRYTVEVTVYLSPDHIGRGLGTKLYTALFAELKNKSIVNVLACIALPNPQSIALHEKFNMQQVANFNKVGLKFDDWVDVGYWQGTL